MRVAKIYDVESRCAYYFVNGRRSEAYDDRSLLEELLGDEFQEYWLISGPKTAEDDEVLSRMESAESFEEFEALVEEHEHLVEEV